MSNGHCNIHQTSASSNASMLRDGTPAIDVNSVGVEFKTSEYLLPCMLNLSFKVPRGSFTCIIGPSGCGKTTLLRLIAGLIQEESESIHIRGSVTVYGETPSLARQNRRLAFVMQQSALLPWRTVRQNVSFPFEIVPFHQSNQDNLINKALDMVGLTKFSDFRPAELSAGMRHRAALARALLLQPPIWLFDEPFSHLDEITRSQLQEDVLSIWTSTACTVLWVTHTIEEAVFLADRVLVMGNQPSKIETAIDICLRRPRTKSLVKSAEFLAAIDQVRTALWAAVDRDPLSAPSFEKHIT